VLALLLVRFPGLLAAPGVRLSPHRALHGLSRRVGSGWPGARGREQGAEPVGQDRPLPDGEGWPGSPMPTAADPLTRSMRSCSAGASPIGVASLGMTGAVRDHGIHTGWRWPGPASASKSSLAHG